MMSETMTAAAELRKLSPRAEASLDLMNGLAASLAQSPRHATDAIARPHPLLLMVRRGSYSVLISPAVVWDNARDLFTPYTDALSALEARILLLGRPEDPD